MLQSKNLPMSGAAIAQAISTAGGATQTGSTRTSVCLFAAAAIPALGTGIAVTNDAANGTEIALTEPGVYAVQWGFDVDAGATVVYGTSVSVVAGAFTADPSFSFGGMLAVNSITTPAATVISGGHSIQLPLNRALVNVAGGAVVQFLASDGAGAAPAGIVLASMWYRVARVQDVFI